MPFDPSSISGLLLWLRGDAGVYHDSGVTLCASGQGVQQWNDQSGNGNNAVCDTTAAAGLYTTGVGPSLLPVIQVTTLGVLNVGFPTVITPGTPYTIFLVVQAASDSLTGDHRCLAGTNNWLIGPRGGKWAHYAAGFVSSGVGPTVNATDFVRMVATNSGSASHFYVEGTDITTSTAPVGVPGGLVIGRGGDTRFAGNYAEILVYNSVLSSTNLTNINSYLARWQTVPGVPILTNMSGNIDRYFDGGFRN